MATQLKEWMKTDIETLESIGEKIDASTAGIAEMSAAMTDTGNQIVEAIGHLRDEAHKLGAAAAGSLSPGATHMRELIETSIHLRAAMRVSVLASVAGNEEIRRSVVALYCVETIVQNEHLDADAVTLRLKQLGKAAVMQPAHGLAKQAGIESKFNALFAKLDASNPYWRRDRLREIEDLCLDVIASKTP